MFVDLTMTYAFKTACRFKSTSETADACEHIKKADSSHSVSVPSDYSFSAVITSHLHIKALVLSVEVELNACFFKLSENVVLDALCHIKADRRFAVLIGDHLDSES